MAAPAVVGEPIGKLLVRTADDLRITAVLLASLTKQAEGNVRPGQQTLTGAQPNPGGPWREQMRHVAPSRPLPIAHSRLRGDPERRATAPIKTGKNMSPSTGVQGVRFMTIANFLLASASAERCPAASNPRPSRLDWAGRSSSTYLPLLPAVVGQAAGVALPHRLFGVASRTRWEPQPTDST